MLLRFLPIALCACGGFNTPDQPVAFGLALNAPVLPPRGEANGNTMTLSRLRLAFTAIARRSGKDEQRLALGGPRVLDAPLDVRWLELQTALLPRGAIDRLELDVTAMALDGTWNGAAFHLEATEPRTRELTLVAPWQIELGESTALSLIADPILWVGKRDSNRQLELIDPAESDAARQLIDRFFDSLAVARDDNHDGMADAP